MTLVYSALYFLKQVSEKIIDIKYKKWAICFQRDLFNGKNSRKGVADVVRLNMLIMLFPKFLTLIDTTRKSVYVLSCSVGRNGLEAHD